MEYAIKFRDFRTRALLEQMMLDYCKATRGGAGLRGCCPDPACKSGGHKCLNAGAESVVAYCHWCHKTFDALAIMCAAEGCSLWDAAAQLEPLIYLG